MIIININDAKYPAALKELSNPPENLYVEGDVSLLKSKNTISVLGTRRASAYGKWITREIVKAISKRTLVTKFSEGICNTAITEYIFTGGSCIAVLATGIDICFPLSAKNLYKEVIGHGSASIYSVILVSPFPPGTKATQEGLALQNEIVAALSDTVIVPECSLESMTFKTLREAMKKGTKRVFAIPGNINQPNAIGPNTLIAEGATPILDPTKEAIEKTVKENGHE